MTDKKYSLDLTEQELIVLQTALGRIKMSDDFTADEFANLRKVFRKANLCSLDQEEMQWTIS
jgi:hypothetical protein